MDASALHPAPHVRAALAPEGGVLLDPCWGRHVALSRLGAVLWRALLAGESLDRGVRRLATECSQPVERVRRDAETFRARAQAEGLVVEGLAPRPARPESAPPLDPEMEPAPAVRATYLALERC